MEAHALALEKNADGIELLRILTRKGLSEYASNSLQNLGVTDNLTMEKCYLCDGKFNFISHFVEIINQKIQGISFNSYLVGIKIPSQILEREDELRSQFGVKWGETIRNEFSREIGKEFSKDTKKEVDYKRPDLVVTINPFTEEISFQINPIFVYGRYRKLEAGIPQSKMICMACGGKGCPKCKGLEKIYGKSVEEFISTPFLKASGGNDEKFHAAGREGADTRILGSGRPFVLEIKNPVRRDIDLIEIAVTIKNESEGKIEVDDLKFCLKETVRTLKAHRQLKKTYRLEVLFENPLSEDELKQLEEQVVNYNLPEKSGIQTDKGLVVKQEKQIYESKVNRLTQNSVEIIITSMGGQYIKELIGKKGEVESTLSQFIKNPIKKMGFDIVDISWV